jgi:hypothetical protein
MKYIFHDIYTNNTAKVIVIQISSVNFKIHTHTHTHTQSHKTQFNTEFPLICFNNWMFVEHRKSELLFIHNIHSAIHFATPNTLCSCTTCPPPHQLLCLCVYVILTTNSVSSSPDTVLLIGGLDKSHDYISITQVCAEYTDKSSCLKHRETWTPRA